MYNITNLEVIQITTKEGKLVATLSYQDQRIDALKNGYAIIDVPINIRELQLSSRDNVLVDQSVKGDCVSDSLLERAMMTQNVKRQDK